MTLISDKRKQDAAADFALLKKNAKTAGDICVWFQKNPGLIPGLPAEFYDKVTVDYTSSEEFTVDSTSGTIFEDYTFYFNIQSIDKKDENLQLHDVTGLNFSEHTKSRDFFDLQYDVKLYIHEWKFLALGGLLDLDEDALEDPIFSGIYQKAVACFYPEFSWETFVALWHAGLVPTDKDELEVFLSRGGSKVGNVAVPTDLSIL